MQLPLVRRAVQGACLLIFLCCYGCAAPEAKVPSELPARPEKTVPLPSRELDVITDLLQAKYADSIDRGATLVIDDTTSMGAFTNSDYENDLLKSAPREVPREAILNFVAQNKAATRLGPELASRFKVYFLSSSEASIIWRDRHGWDRFYKRFPNSLGTIEISRVGFSRDGHVAVAYIGGQQHWLAGGGRVIYLRLIKSHWVIQAGFGPEWIS